MNKYFIWFITVLLLIAAVGSMVFMLAPKDIKPNVEDNSVSSKVPVDSKPDETEDSSNSGVDTKPDVPNDSIKDDITLINSKDCEDTVVVIEGIEYRALSLEATGLIPNAYYYSEKAGATIYESGDANTAAKFYATKTFTKDTLPMGSVIWVNSGWQYRPEGWVFTGRRPDNTMCTYVTVNEEWWEAYDIRGFNIMKTNSGSLVGTSAETVYENFKIYIPVDLIFESEEA